MWPPPPGAVGARGSGPKPSPFTGAPRLPRETPPCPAPPPPPRPSGPRVPWSPRNGLCASVGPAPRCAGHEGLTLPQTPQTAPHGCAHSPLVLRGWSLFPNTLRPRVRPFQLCRKGALCGVSTQPPSRQLGKDTLSSICPSTHPAAYSSHLSTHPSARPHPSRIPLPTTHPSTQVRPSAPESRGPRKAAAGPSRGPSPASPPPARQQAMGGNFPVL